jgi:hypothetical protein
MYFLFWVLSLFVANIFQDIAWYSWDNKNIHDLHPILYSVEKHDYIEAEKQIDTLIKRGSNSTGILFELKWDIAYSSHTNYTWSLWYYKIAFKSTPIPRILKKIQFLESSTVSERHTVAASWSSDTDTGSDIQTGAIEIQKRIAEIEQYQENRKDALDLTLKTRSEELKNVDTLIQDIQNDQSREIHDW